MPAGSKKRPQKPCGGLVAKSVEDTSRCRSSKLALVVLCIATGIAICVWFSFSASNKSVDRKESRIDAQAVAKLDQLEKDGRLAWASNDIAKAENAFQATLLAARSSDVSAGSKEVANIVTSAHMHLGVFASRRAASAECVAHFDAAHRDPGALAGEFLKVRSWPYQPSQLFETTRYFWRTYLDCLHATNRSADANVLMQRAAKVGVIRHPWQCTLQLSPPEWELRVKPWWEPREVRQAAKLGAELSSRLKSIREESLRLMRDGIAPDGLTVQLNQEIEAVRSGFWQELIIFNKGIFSESACSAVPVLCVILKRFKAHFHGHGHVKLSHMKAGTVAKPHCGPLDTKIRMHFTVALPPHRRAELNVAGITKTWQEGHCLLFDDSLQHFVNFDANPGASRVVLIIDFWHPDLPRKVKADL